MLFDAYLRSIMFPIKVAITFSDTPIPLLLVMYHHEVSEISHSMLMKYLMKYPNIWLYKKYFKSSNLFVFPKSCILLLLRFWHCYHYHCYNDYYYYHCYHYYLSTIITIIIIIIKISIIIIVTVIIIIERSLEVKLPTVWTDGEAEVGRVREEKEWETRRCSCAKR